VKHGDHVHWTVEVRQPFVFTAGLVGLWLNFHIFLSVNEQKLSVRKVMVASMMKIITVLV
jgi:hypothetical protein